jgi:hypothetical protein
LGERNWPFLMLTARWWRAAASAAATTMSVWRQRKAGIWMRSMTGATLFGLLGQVDVGGDRDAEFGLDGAEGVHGLFDAAAAAGGGGGAVGLVE